MPFTSLSVLVTAASGVTLSAPAAVDGTNGNQFTNTGREEIEITNGSGATITVTFAAHYTYTVGSASYPAQPLVVTIPASATKAFGPFDKGFFNNPSTGCVEVTFSAATTVTALVKSLGLF